MSGMHTTLAQDAFHLYYGVIDSVTDKVRQDLIAMGKTAEQSQHIATKLKTKWRQNLDKSLCIDNVNMLGMGVPPSISAAHNPHPIAPTVAANPNCYAGAQQQQQPPPQPSYPYPYPYPHYYAGSGAAPPHMSASASATGAPPRKRVRKNTTAAAGVATTSGGPAIIPPTYPEGNPHIHGMGVPNYEQVHNPFMNTHTNATHSISPPISHPHPQQQRRNVYRQSNRNIPQNDGTSDDIIAINPIIHQFDGPSPSPMIAPEHVGFSDDDDDEADTTAVDTTVSTTALETTSDEKDNPSVIAATVTTAPTTSTAAASSSEAVKYMYKGRDLNAPLNSEDDDSAEEDDDEINDKIYCLFTKVERNKDEWKVELKNGVMHIDGKDYSFSKAQNGKFQWIS